MFINQILTKLKSLVYSKSETDSLLNGKASSSHTHTKSQITDFPTIPSNTSQLTNDSGFITGVSWANVSGKPSTFTPSSHTHTKSQITDFPSLATVATSGSYNDLSNKPSIPSIDLRPQASADANTVSDGVSITHYGSNGPATSLGGSPNDGALFQQCWSSAWKVQIAADYRNGNLFTRGKNNGTWQAWRAVAYHGDKVSKFTNDAGYITSSGSCNYANSAGNSDTLDGYHEYSFLRNRGGTSTSGEGTLWAQIGIKEYNGALPDGLSGVYSWGGVVSLPGTNSRFDIYCSHNSSNGNGLYYRSGWANDKKDWRRFIDSANIGSQSVNYATSAGSAGSCTESAYMNQYDTITYGVNRLQYYNSPTSTTSGAANVANPYNDWFYHLLMSHGNNNGYYGDIALCFHSDTLAFRRIANGTDNGWCYLVKHGRTIVSGYDVYVG